MSLKQMDSKLLQDTIGAIATPIGEGGIGIIRISGPQAAHICDTLFHPKSPHSRLRSHRLYYGWIKEPESLRTVDEVLVSYMAAPHTYTREDIVEINCHSGHAVLQRILELVIEAGARMAEPGEFTRRAFLNGRIDLSQAEAIADIIHARCEKSLELANRHLNGVLKDTLLQWKDSLLQLQAETEATIDFSEDMDDDYHPSDSDHHKKLEQITLAVKRMLQDHERGRILREGLTLVLAGKPNAGKSSLLNALLGKDRAIVTHFPGTTRDVIEDSFILSGVQVRILDTAGIRGGSDTIETLGIEKSLSSVQQADVVLWLIDQSRPLDEQDDLVFQSVACKTYYPLLNKNDLPPRVSPAEILKRYQPSNPPLCLSTLDAEDVEALRTHLARELLQKPLKGFESMIAPNLRQKECLEKVLEALERAKTMVEGKSFGELITLELETARGKLDEVLGNQDNEEVLDRIFSQFCIGK